MSELVEEVDEQGRVLRVVTREEMRAGRLRHRCVYLLVVDAGRLLVHRRSDDKDVFPGFWDVAAGGVVGAGESWDDAATRELAEELGVAGVPVRPLGDVAYEGAGCAVLGRVYLVESAGPFRFADGEVVEARWADRAAVDALLATERVCPDSASVALPLALPFLVH